MLQRKTQDEDPTGWGVPSWVERDSMGGNETLRLPAPTASSPVGATASRAGSSA